MKRPPAGYLPRWINLNKNLPRAVTSSARVSWKPIGVFFCTLVRFDAVYYGHFKCNLRRILDYPNLDGYLRDLYQQPGIRETVNFEHIKRHYYFTHDDINPTRIVPLGPVLDLNRRTSANTWSRRDL
jgi:hypothetical protein